MTLVSKWLSRFNYPERSCLDPALDSLKFCGMWYRARPAWRAFMFSIFLIFNVLFVIAVCANLALHFSNDLLMEFIQYVSFYVGVCRSVTLVFHQRRWAEITDMMVDIENESSSEKGTEHSAIVYRHKNYCQCITYSYWISFLPLLIFFVLFFWLNNVLLPVLRGTEEPLKLLFATSMPFDQNAHRELSATLQSMFAVAVAIGMWTWDTVLLASWIFFAGQLKALRARCLHALDSGDEEQSLANIVKCHKHYVALMKFLLIIQKLLYWVKTFSKDALPYAIWSHFRSAVLLISSSNFVSGLPLPLWKLRRCKKLFNSLTIWITFPHITQVSVVCAVCIIKIAAVNNNTAELIKTIDLLLGINLQLLLFYSVTNKVIVQGEPLAYGIFESSWVEASVRVRRAVLMLGLGMRRRVAFTAGPFNEMSLATLVSIWRATYSFYALLSQTRNKD